VGTKVGSDVGMNDADGLNDTEGTKLGRDDGTLEGILDGSDVGFLVGLGV